jgi:osmotically-inducible protein OsmY
MSRLHPQNETNLPAASDVLSVVGRNRILSEADSRLRRLSYPQLWKIICEFHEGVLTLRGAVNSYFLKQLAFATVASVNGVQEVSDRLEVRYSRCVAILNH